MKNYKRIFNILWNVSWISLNVMACVCAYYAYGFVSSLGWFSAIMCILATMCAEKQASAMEACNDQIIHEMAKIEACRRLLSKAVKVISDEAMKVMNEDSCGSLDVNMVMGILDPVNKKVHDIMNESDNVEITK